MSKPMVTSSACLAGRRATCRGGMVFGSETEWGIQIKDKMGSEFFYRRPDPRELDAIVRIVRKMLNLPHQSYFGWETAGQERRENDNPLLITNLTFLTNGARCYVDYPHLEYSTPECRSVFDLVAAEKAGEMIVEKAVAEFSREIGKEVLLLKHVSDRNGHSFAAHENYLISRKLFDELVNHPLDGKNKKAAIWLSFLAVRHLITGSGKVGSEIKQDDQNYKISQRTEFIQFYRTLTTTFDRAMINTRDEPFADPTKWGRLHVIIGDANLCQTALALKYFLSSQILKMLEDDFLSIPVFKEPGDVFQTISQDLSLKEKFRLATDEEMSGLEYLGLISEKIEEYNRGTNDQEILLLSKKLKEVITGLNEEPRNLFGVLDWPTKLVILEELEKIRQRNFGEKKRIDILYHLIGPTGFYRKMEEKGRIEQLVPKSKIIHFQDNPPVDTLAYLRGKCVRVFPEIVANWHCLHHHKLKERNISPSGAYFDTQHFQIFFADPFIINRETADDLFSRISYPLDLIKELSKILDREN